MNLQQLKEFLASHGAGPSKRFSQNFLFRDHVLERIIDHVPDGAAFYIEIGGGIGTLTEKAVLRRFNPFTIVDLDDSMLEILRERFSGSARILKQDGSKLNFREYFKGERGAVFGNLPYAVSSPILFNTCFQSSVLKSAVFLLQKEVAEKVVSQPCERDFSPIAALIQLIGSAEMLFSIPPEEFYPAPKVWSSLIKINFNDHDFEPEYLEKFASALKKLFQTAGKPSTTFSRSTGWTNRFLRI